MSSAPARLGYPRNFRTTDIATSARRTSIRKMIPDTNICFTFSVVNSAGFYGQRGEVPFDGMVAAILALALVFSQCFRPANITAGGRAELLAAGRAVLATYLGTAFHDSYVIGSLAGIMVSAVMLRSTAFGKGPGYTGILGNVIGLGLYLPVIGIMVSAASGVILWV